MIVTRIKAVPKRSCTKWAHKFFVYLFNYYDVYNFPCIIILICSLSHLSPVRMSLVEEADNCGRGQTEDSAKPDERVESEKERLYHFCPLGVSWH